jgi:hypothetical protein
MKKYVSLSHPDLPYTAFLFEPLGDDYNGMPLVLASILGRMSLDPWSEAASFAAMPTAVAKQKLASLIDAMPTHAVMRPESNTLAERLISLLPTRPKPPGAATKSSADNCADTHSDRHADKGHPLLRYLGWIFLLCVVLVGASFG